jgi:hypothetical protein
MDHLSLPLQKESPLFEWKKKEKDKSPSVQAAPMKNPQKELPLGIRFYI